MHYSTYVIYKDINITKDYKGEMFDYIQKRFQSGYCYSCGETVAAIEDYCDWFTIGGRWMNAFTTKKPGTGIKGEWAYCIGENETKEYEKLQAVKNKCDIANIKDIKLDKLVEPYTIIINGQPPVSKKKWNSKKQEFEDNSAEFNQLFNDIKAGKYTGVIANIDCHD